MLGGEARTMTIMFSDVRGFTTISETYKDDPQGLTQLMNRFLTPLTNAIIERKGTIDKYMGDAIMAFWNAPIDDAEHEINACRAAIDMLRRVDDLNLEREAEARDERAAFHPDPDRRRHQYRHLRGRQYGLGPAFRLFGARAIRSISPRGSKAAPRPTARRSSSARRPPRKRPAQFAALELDLITVKGKTEPERIYTILGGEDVAGERRFPQAARAQCHDAGAATASATGPARLEALQLCRQRAE